MTKLPCVTRRALIRHASTLLLPIWAASAAFAAPLVQNIGIPAPDDSGLWPGPDAPVGNPFIASALDPHTPAPGSATVSKQFLGLALFWDEQLSSDNSMACGTCHAFTAGGYDGRIMGSNSDGGRGSHGIIRQDSQRNFIADPTPTPGLQQRQVTSFVAPTVIGSGFLSRVLWKSNAGPSFTPTTPGANAADFASNAALEAQAVGPELNNIEMAHEMFDFAALSAKLNNAEVLRLATLSTVPDRLKSIVDSNLTYGQLFDIIFQNDPNFGGQVGVTRDRIAMAIATYERTLVPNQAPIDEDPLSAAAERGFNLFYAPTGSCTRCHANQTVFFGTHVPELTGTGGFKKSMDSMLTDGRLHGGINFPPSAANAPNVTGNARGNVGVKTPTLRNIMLKKRFGHNGFMGDIDELLDFLNGNGPNQPTFRFQSGSLAGGRLSQNELDDVKAFFDSLTDPRLVPTSPGAPLPMPFQRPDLYSERIPFASNEPANLGGQAAPGGFIIPDIINHLPGIAGDPFFSVGVGNMLSGAPVRLGISPNPLPATSTGPFHLNTSGISIALMVANSDGFATHKTTLPTSLIGTTMSFQAAVRDQFANGTSFSNASEILIQ